MATTWVADDQPSRRFPLWTRGNTGEIFPNAIMPLTATFIGSAVRRGQISVFRSMGLLTDDVIAVDDGALGTGVFGGYLYANGTLFRLLGVRAPGMTATSGDEQVFGPGVEAPPYTARPGDKDWRSTLRISRYLMTALRRPELRELDTARSDAQHWLSRRPADDASDEALLAYLASYQPRIEASMARLLRWSAVAAGPRAIAEQLLTGRSSAPPGVLNHLVGGVGDVDSAQLAVQQWQLGRLVAGDPGLTAAFDLGLEGLAERLHGTPFAERLDAFLARFGHRGPQEYELAVPSWSMDSHPVLAAIERLRLAPPDRDPALATRSAEAARQRAAGELASAASAPKRKLVERCVAVSRTGSVGRERAKDILVLENLGARLVLRELLARATRRGGTEDVRTAWCVTWDELPGYLRSPAALTSELERRRQYLDLLDGREPPLWFEDTIADPVTWPTRHAAGVVTAGSVLSGVAVSGGSWRGRARVVTDAGDPGSLEPGDVLIARLTDPAWTPLFLVAGAVVCELGAPQSHAAIVARELGIPGVMGVVGATGIPDGTWIVVDGDRGIVSLE